MDVATASATSEVFDSSRACVYVSLTSDMAWDSLTEVGWLLFNGGILDSIKLDFSLYFMPILIKSSTASFSRLFSFSLSVACPVMFVISFFFFVLTLLGF